MRERLPRSPFGDEQGSVDIEQPREARSGGSWRGRHGTPGMLASRSMTSPPTLALVLLLAAGPAAAPHDRTAAAEPASSGFTLRLAIPTIVSNDAFMWVVPFRLFNPGGMGLYTDSLVCEVDSQDPNVPERARHTVTPAFNA